MTVDIGVIGSEVMESLEDNEMQSSWRFVVDRALALIFTFFPSFPFHTKAAWSSHSSF